jgi:uncharacterized protein
VTGPRIFLTATWRHLAMLNYEVEPRVLEPLVPYGTELDTWNGRTFASLVGFRFLETRVLGVAIPGHRDFDEVNLRFYVRRRAEDGWRRGVVFVKEIVPRAAIAFVANVVYGERYVAYPMSHDITEAADGSLTARYAWRSGGREHHIAVATRGAPSDVAMGSDAEFITEHYFGYARRRGGGSTEYQVEHPRWKVAPAASNECVCDVAATYGPEFAPHLRGSPASAFVADGSPVIVYKGVASS